MQIALIPPTNLLSEFMYLSDMQLVLPDPWMHDEAYRYAMNQYRKRYNQYRILDNGAAEFIPIDDAKLMSLIEMVQPDEFALPDVLGDAEETFNRSMAFLDRYSERIRDSEVKVGFVAQGKNGSEAFAVAERMLEATPVGLIETIFLPRLLTREDIWARMRVAEGINSRYDVDIHLFGMSENWPVELSECAGNPRYGFIRSMDTAMPFYYAKAGKGLPSGRVTEWPKRAQYYFDQNYNAGELELVQQNVKTVLDWSRE